MIEKQVNVQKNVKILKKKPKKLEYIFEVITAGHCIPPAINYEGSNGQTYTINITPSASQFKVIVGGHSKSRFGKFPSVTMYVDAVARVIN